MFGRSRVNCFGIGDVYKPGQTAMYPQVSVLDYKTPDDFVIELPTKSEGDQLFPEQGLLATSSGHFWENIAACGQRKCRIAQEDSAIVDRMRICWFVTPKQAVEAADWTYPPRRPPSRKSNHPLV